MSIGNQIALYRKSLNMTQEQLGRLVGVSNQAVSKWESEISMPDIMLLPRIASVLEITLDDLFAEQTDNHLQTKAHVFNMDAVRRFSKDAQTMIVDAMCRQTNLINCNSWDFLKVDKNASTKKIDHIKKNTTLCCLSDTVGSTFVSDNLTVIDSSTAHMDIGSLFERTEIAHGIKKLLDANVRKVLSYICNEYFHSSAPFDSSSSEYFVAVIRPKEISCKIGLTEDELMEVLDKLISLHIVELQTNDDSHYVLHKVKAIEAAVTFKVIERFINNEVGFGCGEFLTLGQFE